jgi:predicted Zn-dependent peptidase
MKFNFYKKVLKNGMTIIFEKRDVPVVCVAFAVRNGGINESLEEKGISHFIEHLLYKGTPTRSAKQIAEEIEKKGGILNGFTDEEITAYWCKMPSEHLKITLDVLSDMIKNPKFDVKELEKERKVIFEEIKMRKDNPQIYTFDKIEGFLYDGTLGIPLIGTYDTMNSITREKIVEKFKQIYSPNNMILCIVGNADFKEIIDFAEKNFGNEKEKIPEQKFSLKNEEKIEKRNGLDQANLIFAYHVPLAGDKKCYSAKVLGVLMAEGMSSILFSEIREKRNLAYSIRGGSEINKRFAYNLIYAGTMKKNVGIVKKIILEEFKKVADSITEKELNQVKEQIVGNYHISIDDSQDQMMSLLHSEISTNAEDFYEFEKNIMAVKIEDVKKIAEEAVKNHSFFALVPEKD